MKNMRKKRQNSTEKAMELWYIEKNKKTPLVEQRCF